MTPYLASSQYIDWHHPSIIERAAQLADGTDTEHAYIERCFTLVRDTIRHSGDFQSNPVTCRASDVLLHEKGYCFAKSHLLAALLRAQGIPAGLCYQRVAIDANGQSFSLHGLNAVHLKQHGWYRIDARGNKPSVQAAFCPPVEKLAFSIRQAGEKDFPDIWAEPLPSVAHALTTYSTIEQLSAHFPDAGHIASTSTQKINHPC